MSQKKVDEYKKYKANRKQIIAREKKMKKIKKAVATVCAVAIIGGLGYWSVYSYQDTHKPEIEFTNLLNQDEGGFYAPILDE